MSVLGDLKKWVSYSRLGYYPKLKPFDRDVAYQRVIVYEKAEKKAREPWWTMSVTVSVISMLGIYVLFFFYVTQWYGLILGLFLALVPSIILNQTMYRPMRRRVEESVIAELQGGRFSNCIDCGYDLRATMDRCPECGASVFVKPPLD